MSRVVGIAILMLCAIMPLISHAKNSPRDYLTPHNKARAVVGVEPLQWDVTLAKYAQEYANQRIGDCALRHSGGPYGENIFWGYPASQYNAAYAVESWVSEKADYDYETNSCSKDCGHYTQVVWRETNYVGCARAVCDNDGGVFIICSYNLPGNYVGQRPY